jgi:hypothetical protein
MKTGKATSVYLPERLIPCITKRGIGLAGGITAALGRYYDLLAPTISRVEREFSKEIPVLAKLAPVQEWREKGVRSAVSVFVQDAEDIFPLDKVALLDRLANLSVLESYALAEAIERAAK